MDINSFINLDIDNFFINYGILISLLNTLLDIFNKLDINKYILELNFYKFLKYYINYNNFYKFIKMNIFHKNGSIIFNLIL